jgi:hypothetical protein
MLAHNRLLHRLLLGALIAMVFTVPLYGKDIKVPTPKEFGIYIKTAGGLKKIMPNVVFEEQGMIFIESNNPPRFPLKDMEYFVIYGTHNMDVLTMNPLLFVQASPLGKTRFMFGKNIDLTAQKKGENLYMVKPKGLLGRGYYCLWIEDTVWDFVIE